jgi:hypothetical protein
MRDDIGFLDSLVQDYSAGYFSTGFKIRYMIDFIEKNYPQSPERDAHLSNARTVLAARVHEEFERLMRIDGFQAEEFLRRFIKGTEVALKGFPSSYRDPVLEWARDRLAEREAQAINSAVADQGRGGGYRLHSGQGRVHQGRS